MTAYIIRRLLLAVLVLVLVSVLIFLIMRLLPGDPLLMLMSKEQISTYSKNQLAELRYQYGLDKPVVYALF